MEWWIVPLTPILHHSTTPPKMSVTAIINPRIHSTKTIQHQFKSNLSFYHQKYKAIWELEKRVHTFYEDTKGANILVTSSFGTTSAILLHLIAQVKPDQSIHFIDTSYHFDETLFYKAQLEDLLNLNIITLRGNPALTNYTRIHQNWQKEKWNQFSCRSQSPGNRRLPIIA